MAGPIFPYPPPVAFSERLRDQLDLPSLAAELDATVRPAIAPSSLAAWLRSTAQ